MPGMFQFERSEREGVTVLTLVGSLDAATSTGLKKEVVALTDGGKTHGGGRSGEARRSSIRPASACSSRCSSASRAAGGAVHFAGLVGQPKEIFRLLRLDRSLDLHPSLDDALAKLKG